MYVLRLDYATFVFHQEVTPKKVSEALVSDKVDLSWHKLGVAETAPYQSPFGLYMRRSGFGESPWFLQVSGAGCEHFCPTLYTLYKWYPCHFSRLDFAFDVIMDRDDWWRFVCVAFEESRYQKQNGRKKYDFKGSGEAATVYIGSRTSDYYFRIYNKSLENPLYKYFDPVSGEEVMLKDDQCIIRYEIEFHRRKRSRDGKEFLTDPTIYFDYYYSSSEDFQKKLIEKVRELWISFGNDILLPLDIETAEFTLYNKEKFCSIEGWEDPDPVVREFVASELHEEPHSFSRTVVYVAEHFGAYIPYVLQSEYCKGIALDQARARFGWDIPIFVEFGDTNEFIDLDDTPVPFEDPPITDKELDYYMTLT